MARGAAETAGELLAASGGARRRRLRRRNRRPLPNLFEVHPEARNAPSRELGLQTIPVAEIVGTAVEGPDQRGGDFLPPRPFRSQDWAARWLRITKAVDRLEVLPPIEVILAGGGYWVTDGHNRVAAALYSGQLAIDALVRGLRLTGEPATPPSGSLAAMLAEGEQLRAAGSGLLTPGSRAAPHEGQDPSARRRSTGSAAGGHGLEAGPDPMIGSDASAGSDGSVEADPTVDGDPMGSGDSTA